jgi:glycosyltransferase involved in cell wall biosynthesis
LQPSNIFRFGKLQKHDWKTGMIANKKIVIVLPAYNAALTLKKTYQEIPFDIVDDVILVDDNSSDKTIEIAKQLNITHIIKHDKNRGYGGNQKTCYNKALEIGGDIIIMLHPDYQYTPKLIPSMAYLIANNVYQVVLGSRTLGKGALHGGMPLYKYVANRALTFFENVMLNQKVAEYHTGYRAFSREVLQRINYEINSEDFVFDNQMLSQIIYLGYEIAEITCPTRYFEEASSINLQRSITYGLGVLKVSVVHRLCKWRLMKRKMYTPVEHTQIKK